MVSTLFKVTLATTALLASACAKTETTAAVEKTADTVSATAQATERKLVARGGNIVALPEEGGKKYIVGPNGDAVVKIKVTAEDTGGAYEVATEDHPKGFMSNPHIHPYGAQSFYVVRGEYEYYFDDVKGTAGPGAVWHVPPGVVHVIHAKTEGQVVLIYSPVKFQERIDTMKKVTKEQRSDPEFMKAKLLEMDVVNIDQSWLEERR